MRGGARGDEGVRGRLPREHGRVVEADRVVGEDVVVAQHDGTAQPVAAGAADRRGEGARYARDDFGEDRPAWCSLGSGLGSVVRVMVRVRVRVSGQGWGWG